MVFAVAVAAVVEIPDLRSLIAHPMTEPVVDTEDLFVFGRLLLVLVRPTEYRVE